MKIIQSLAIKRNRSSNPIKQSIVIKLYFFSLYLDTFKGCFLNFCSQVRQKASDLQDSVSKILHLDDKLEQDQMEGVEEKEWVNIYFLLVCSKIKI
jgi:hypothetical protein